MNCYLHPELEAVTTLNVPCAPGGKIHICEACANDPNIAEKTWKKYQAEHNERIQMFKKPGNPDN